MINFSDLITTKEEIEIGDILVNPAKDCLWDSVRELAMIVREIITTKVYKVDLINIDGEFLVEGVTIRNTFGLLAVAGIVKPERQGLTMGDDDFLEQFLILQERFRVGVYDGYNSVEELLNG